MSFFEDLAAALDADGIESRVGGDILFVPITSEVEIQFVEIDAQLPAANVYIAAADVDEDDEDFSAALVAVVFSVEDAVRTVAAHVAIDQVITILNDLLDATDERIGDLEFVQDIENPNLVRAEVGTSSELRVLVESVDDSPRATASFVTVTEAYEELVDKTIDQIWQSDADSSRLSEYERQQLFGRLADDAADYCQEVLSLGSFTDFDKLFDVLSLAADQAESWEDQLSPLGPEPSEDLEVFEIFANYLDEDALGGLSRVGRRGIGRSVEEPEEFDDDDFEYDDYLDDDDDDEDDDFLEDDEDGSFDEEDEDEADLDSGDVAPEEAGAQGGRGVDNRGAER